MKNQKVLKNLIFLLGGVSCAALIAAAALSGGSPASAEAETGRDYSQPYRNRLAFSPAKGWNNDPNGLLCDGEKYHAYYQYNLDENDTGWGHMSWGHAVSRDLVHWEQRPVALPAFYEGNLEYTMFSGSAVYDEYNTSGLFETDPATGKVIDGHGIVALLTQPDPTKGGEQRQSLAYSLDGGDSFSLLGEVLGADESVLKDGEFRDPKVFWSARHNKWLMAVGGGAVRMYSSENLKEWEYLGDTGFWGECPDVSRFEVDGEEKYALIISPEDKEKAHERNRTTRESAYYPAEYYVIGDLDENGLFTTRQTRGRVQRLSEGIDSYAFQSFNNSPEGKVYGLSWSASWNTVDYYRDFREVYNGGLTVATELKLKKEGNNYTLLRAPVEGYTDLRGEKSAEFSGKLAAGKNAFEGETGDVADIDVELDFNGSDATYAEILLRSSDVERTVLRYDVRSETLTLDRSESSLLAKDTFLYKAAYSKKVALREGKLSLRILLDRAFISAFANGGEASFFTAVFPSAISKNLSLTSDGEISIGAAIYPIEGIFGKISTADKLVLSSHKFDMCVGETREIVAASFADNFNGGNVAFSVEEGGEFIELSTKGGATYIRARRGVHSGAAFAKIKVEYDGQPPQFIEVFIYKNGYSGDLDFCERYRGYSYISDEGLAFEVFDGDAFLFGDTRADEFIYSAYFSPKNGAQAGGLSFGYRDNSTLSHFWFVTADVKENMVKVVRFGGAKDFNFVVTEARYDFSRTAARYKLTVVMQGGELKAYVNEDKVAAVACKIDGYAGGRLGVNIFNGDDPNNAHDHEGRRMIINGVVARNIVVGENLFDCGAREVKKVVNITDGSRALTKDDYTVVGGYLSINDGYLETLEADTEYTFRVLTDGAEFDIKVKTDFAQASLVLSRDSFKRGEGIALTVGAGATVGRVEVDGRSVEYTLGDGGRILIAASEIESLIGGTHEVKVYTSKGRPAASFEFIGAEEYRDEEVELISHTFFYIDIAIFATLILGYAAFAVTKKCLANKKARASGGGEK